MIRRTLSALGLLIPLAFAASSRDLQESSLYGDDSKATMLASPELLKKNTPKVDYPTFSVPDSLFRLSSGDQLRLRWWGIGSGDLDLVVDTRGDLVIPDMGRIHTRNRVFREVRDSIEAMLKRRVKTNLVDVQITKVSKAMVRISGLIRQPGVYKCDPGTRVSELLSKAGLDPAVAIDSLTSDMPGLYYPKDPNPSIRKILVVRGKDSTWVDMVRALRAGDASQDPPLFDGDAVRIFPRQALVSISTGVFRGYVEAVPGETVGSALEAVGASDISQPVEIMDRFGALRKVLPESTLLDTNTALIRASSKVSVSSPAVVWIGGQVIDPGAYPFAQGMKASDLVKMAGGIVGGADSGVVVSTKKGWNWLAAAREPALPESYQIPELKVAMIDYVNHMRGNYSDPEAALQVGDTVTVFKAEQVVWVGGKVNRPGFVTWKKGADVDYYVAAAGGFAPRAWQARTQVFDWPTVQAVGLDQPIRPSAGIVVPEERFISPDQWFSIAATTASLAIALVGLMIQVSK